MATFVVFKKQFITLIDGEKIITWNQELFKDLLNLTFFNSILLIRKKFELLFAVLLL